MTDDGDARRLSAAAAAEAIRAGRLTSEALVRSCLAAIAACEARVGAWAFLDPEQALAQARGADRARADGRPLGPLHGVPVGVKDVFDTADMPTELGTRLHAGRRPGTDAAAVARLRDAGAVIMGKTVTTEYAVAAAGKTTNPHDPRRTPGGSSSGSAAAVAAFMVPLAVGTQTGASIVRPAAFCGVWGYKPSFGLISRRGLLPLSRRFDQVGVFARTAHDAALVAERLIGHDAEDPDTAADDPPALAEAARGAAPPPRLAFVRTTLWSRMEPDEAARLEAFVRTLGDRVQDVALPALFDAAVEAHRTLCWAEMAACLDADYRRGREGMSERLRAVVEEGRAIPAEAVRAATARLPAFAAALQATLGPFDAAIAPAAAGEAPRLEAGTGDPLFAIPWTLCGAPAISAPLLRGRSGLPLGVQLVAPRGHDTRLLRAARWLEGAVGGRP